ncbi:exodeoxyribonuclease VII large subunit [Hyphomicrobiales bacterium]|nr:exodeoxyribonuclease VII large subunit [Hyphomicrobiales bacterium]
MNSTIKNTLELSVSELSESIKGLIENNFEYVRVRGEIGRVSKPASGHIYFDLKDSDSVISGIIWKGNALKLDIRPEEGLEVICTGKVTTYKGQSKYQIIVDKVEAAGIGALMALLEKRKKILEAEGLFSDRYKKAIPYLPKTIGVITSPSGAVIRDIIHRLEERFPLHVIVWPVRVQGETCPEEVVDAIEGFHLVDQSNISRPDVIIIARGGGSLEDLWGFNDESVARAVFNSKIPIISAIGHETDNTLIDLVSDLRAPTPTAAAEKAVPVKEHLLEGLRDNKVRLKSSILRKIREKNERNKIINMAFPSILKIIQYPQQRVENISLRISLSLKSTISHFNQKFLNISNLFKKDLLITKASNKRECLMSDADLLKSNFSSFLVSLENRLNLSIGLLSALSHENVLKRGFSIVKDTDLKLVKSSKSLKKNQKLKVFFSSNDIIDVEVHNDKD